MTTNSSKINCKLCSRLLDNEYCYCLRSPRFAHSQILVEPALSVPRPLESPDNEKSVAAAREAAGTIANVASCEGEAKTQYTIHQCF